jgi:hypothetical protein
VSEVPKCHAVPDKESPRNAAESRQVPPRLTFCIENKKRVYDSGNDSGLLKKSPDVGMSYNRIEITEYAHRIGQSVPTLPHWVQQGCNSSGPEKCS